MIRYITIILILFSLIHGQKDIIAVVDFQNNGLPANEVLTLTDRLRSELVQMSDYVMVERGEMYELLNEQEFQLSGNVDNNLIQLGMMLGATDIIVGSIGKVGKTFTISARLVGVEKGEIKNAISFDSKYSIDDLLTIGMRECAIRLLQKNDNLKEKKKLNSKPKILSSKRSMKLQNTWGFAAGTFSPINGVNEGISLSRGIGVNFNDYYMDFRGGYEFAGNRQSWNFSAIVFNERYQISLSYGNNQDMKLNSKHTQVYSIQKTYVTPKYKGGLHASIGVSYISASKYHYILEDWEELKIYAGRKNYIRPSISLGTKW